MHVVPRNHFFFMIDSTPCTLCSLSQKSSVSKFLHKLGAYYFVRSIWKDSTECFISESYSHFLQFNSFNLNKKFLSDGKADRVFFENHVLLMFLHTFYYYRMNALEYWQSQWDVLQSVHRWTPPTPSSYSVIKNLPIILHLVVIY